LFRGADCDTDLYLVVEKIRERLAVNKQTTHRLLGEKFNLKKLKVLESIEISNRFATSGNLDAEVDINRAWESVGENIKISGKGNPGYYELKEHKPWVDKRCSELRY
jgi:hypothetical protein